MNDKLNIMENVLNRANQLLQNANPEQALLLLNDLKDSTPQSEELKNACRQTLSQQYIYLLREASNEGDVKTATDIATKYKDLIGENYKVEELLKEAILKSDARINATKKNNQNVGDNIDTNPEEEIEYETPNNTIDVFNSVLTIIFFALIVIYLIPSLFRLFLIA